MIQPIRSYLRRTAAAIAVAAAMAVPSEAFAQFRWGAQAGVNVNNLKFKQELVSVDKSTGFSVSVIPRNDVPRYRIRTGYRSAL